MIKNSEALTLAEVKELLAEEESEKSKTALAYIKKFCKIKPEKANQLKKAIEELGIIKLKQKHISKIIDLLPEDSEDLRKIFVGEEVSLDQNEINSILETIKKHK